MDQPESLPVCRLTDLPRFTVLSREVLAEAFRQPVSTLSFFSHIALELRERVYEHLLRDNMVIVNASQQNTITRSVIVMVDKGHSQTRFITRRSYPSKYRYARGWPCASLAEWLTKRGHAKDEPQAVLNLMLVSKQFLAEVREAFHKNVPVYFRRRWDFLDAAMLTCLNPKAQPVIPGRFSAQLFPASNMVFNTIRHLRIDLTSRDDFGPALHTQNVRKVTLSILNTIAVCMPQLRTLEFEVSGDSKLNADSATVFVPDAWFIDAMMLIKAPIQGFLMIAGSAWQGVGSTMRRDKACVQAFSIVMHRHLTGSRKLNGDGTKGLILQLRVISEMVMRLAVCQQCGMGSQYAKAITALQAKEKHVVDMLAARSIATMREMN